MNDILPDDKGYMFFVPSRNEWIEYYDLLNCEKDEIIEFYDFNDYEIKLFLVGY